MNSFEQLEVAINRIMEEGAKGVVFGWRTKKDGTCLLIRGETKGLPSQLRDFVREHNEAKG